MKNKLSVILATLALVISLSVAIYNVYVLNHIQGLTFGGTTNYDTLSLSEGLTVGSAATTTLSSGDIVVNDVNLGYRQLSFTNSSTTLCSFKSLAYASGASTTMSKLVLDFRVATSVDRLIEVGTSTMNQSATTTTWFRQLLPANSKRTMVFDFNEGTTSNYRVKSWLGEPVLGHLNMLNVLEGGTVGTETGDCSLETLRP